MQEVPGSNPGSPTNNPNTLRTVFEPLRKLHADDSVKRPASSNHLEDPRSTLILPVPYDCAFEPEGLLSSRASMRTASLWPSSFNFLRMPSTRFFSLAVK